MASGAALAGCEKGSKTARTDQRPEAQPAPSTWSGAGIHGLFLRAPLLLSRGNSHKEVPHEAGGKRQRWWREAAEESGRLAALAAPMIAVALLQLMMQLISTVMVGHLGESRLQAPPSPTPSPTSPVSASSSPSCEKTRAPLTWEAFKGIGSFMRLAVPSALMICLEWWSSELLVLLSGILPNPALETSVLSICISTVVLLYNLPYGIGTAASVRVSNELGAGNPEGARLVVGVALSIVVCSAALVSTTLLASRHFIGIAFSNEEEVIDYVTRMVPVLSISVITDSLQGVLSGVSRGCGWQHLGAYVNLGAFYLVGIPVALFFGFTMQLRGMGFWIGMIAGGATQVTLLSVITATTKWDKMADKAKEKYLKTGFQHNNKT
ncbi:hypothetical protein ZWY2020_010884 [Hordeum vulgare]|nr:hypothetical protein ZWY2020_010884 [Hordeum vulgare]